MGSPERKQSSARVNGRRTANRKNVNTAKKAERKLRSQEKDAAKRAKYGPSKMPAPMIVRSLDTGEVIEIKDPQRKRPSKTMRKKIEKARHDEERRRELEEKAQWLDESMDLGLDRDSS